MTPLLTSEPARAPGAPHRPAALPALLHASLRDTAASHPGVLAVAATPLTLPDLLDAFAASSADAFYWEQPAQDFALLALGEATGIQPQGDDRFGSVARWWRDTVASAVRAPGCDAQPFAAGGFAFDVQPTPGDGVWACWPRGAWVAPAVVLERRGDASSVQLQTASADAVDDALQLAGQALAARTAGMPPSEAEIAGSEIRLRDDPDHDWWDGSMRVVLDAIAAGSLSKQVLARRVRAFASRPIDVAVVLRRLRGRFPSATTFAVRRNGATFLGASPEELVGLRGDAIEAAALAGTSRPGDGRDGVAAALLHDPKELREHAFVVEALRERLAPFCDGLDVPDAPVLMTLPNLSHLYTPVRGRLAAPRGLLELIADLHPTPAVGAVPRDGDRSAELEPFDRGWYAGPVAWARGDRAGEGDAVVALRCALIRDDHAALYAGCGIVQGSEPEREWREARLKMEAVREALGVHVDPGNGPDDISADANVHGDVSAESSRA